MYNYRPFLKGIIILVIMLLGGIGARAQSTPAVTLDIKNATVETVLQRIEEQTQYRFSYQHSLLDKKADITLNVENAPVAEVLGQILSGRNLTFTVVSPKSIVIVKKTSDSSGASSNKAPLKQITGKVMDENGEPLTGASITVDGGSALAVADIDGNFTIKARPGQTLTVSMVGMYPVKFKVGDKSTYDIEMKDADEALEQVVVIGYGTVKKANLVGAVDQIDSKLIGERGHNNVARALQGQIPGLNVTLGDGKPSRGSSINIRGTGSIGSGGSPLVLIDGVESDISSVNPTDVESVSVLKDASSAAIYGARGAFGVILITTKKGASGKTKVNYNGRISVNERLYKWEDQVVTNGLQWFDNFVNAYVAKEEQQPSGINNVFPINSGYRDRLEAWENDQTQSPVGMSPNGKKYEYYGNNNWFNEFYKKSSLATEHSISISGGNDKCRYYVSGRYSYDNGIYKVGDQYFKNYNTRARGEIQISPQVKIENITSLTINDFKEPMVLYDDQHPLRMLMHQGYPMQQAKNPDGTWTEFAVYSGYAGFIEDTSWQKKHISYLRNQTALTWEAIKDQLFIKGDFSWWHKWQTNESRNTQMNFSTGPGLTGTRGSFSKFDRYNYNTEYYSANATANYIPKFNNDDHYLNILAGFNVEHNKYGWHRMYRRGNLSDKYTSFNLMDGDMLTAVIGEGGNEWAYAGILFRADYTFKGKYLAEFSGRYDGSSKFPSDSQWGFFPSASIAWRFSEENFLASARGWLNNGKLRLSVGSLGNGNASPYSFMSLVNPSTSSVLIDGSKKTYAYVPGLVPSGLTWERTTTYNVGLDLGMLNDRLSFQGDYYIRKTTDMYTAGPTLPAVLGSGAPKGNFADMRTNGWELSLTWRDSFRIAGKPFSYSVKGMVWDYYSTITKFNNETRSLSTYYEGQRVGEIWGYHIEGLYEHEDQVTARTTGTKVGNYDYSQPRGPKNDGTYAPNGKVNQASVAKVSQKSNKYLPGDLMYADLNNDGLVNTGSNTVDDPGDRRVIGNSLPRYQFGLTLSASWNGIGISAFFQGVGQKHWYPSSETSFFWGKYGRPYGYDLLEHRAENVWSEDNPNAYWPRVRGYVSNSGNYELTTVNDRYLQNLAYVRLKNLQVDYSFGKKICQALSMSDLRVYAQAENLFTLSPFFKHCKTIDPEGTGLGDADFSTSNDRGAGTGYPFMRTWTLGLSISF